MHARYYSSGLGRFLSVDPVGGKVGSSQSWNRYSYARNNPILMIDPTGEAWRVYFDFGDSKLEASQRVAVMRGVKKRLEDAGVEDVNVYFSGVKGVEIADNDTVVSVSFSNDVINGNENVSGLTTTLGHNQLANDAVVRERTDQLSGDRLINYLVNTTSHEVGHASGALTRYNNDSSPDGRKGYPFTVMGKHSVDQLSETVFEFWRHDKTSSEPHDAALLQLTNDPSYRQSNRRWLP